MIRDFDIMSTSIKDEITGEYNKYYCVCFYYAMVSDDPWSTLNHYMLFPTYGLAESFLSYIRETTRRINWDYWILQNADSKAEPIKHTAKVEPVLFNIPF